MPDARSAGGLCQRLRIFWKVSGSGQSCREIWRAEANGPPRRCGKIPCPIMPRFARIIFRAVSGVLIIHGIRFAFAADGIRYIRKQWRNLFWTIQTGKAGTNSGRFRGVPLLGGAGRGKNYREKSVTFRDNKGYSGNIRRGNCNAIAMKVRKGGEMKTGKGENVFDFIRTVHGKVAFSGLRKYLPEQTARRLAETAALDTVCAIWERWNGIPVYISTDSRYRTFSVWWIARKTVAGGIKNLRDDSFLDFIRERSGEKFLEATREHLPEKKAQDMASLVAYVTAWGVWEKFKNHQIYLPKGSKYRGIAISRSFTGRNYKEQVRRFGLSEQCIRRILRAECASRREQYRLPGC